MSRPKIVYPVGAGPLRDRLRLKARQTVLAGRWCLDLSAEQDRIRRVSVEYDRLCRSAGLDVPKVNEPPPGWTVEEDRREEWIALGEHLAMRKVS